MSTVLILSLERDPTILSHPSLVSGYVRNVLRALAMKRQSATVVTLGERDEDVRLSDFTRVHRIQFAGTQDELFTLLDARCSQADLIICVDAASSTIAQKVSGDRGLPLVSVVFDDELLAWDSTTLHWSDKLYVQSEHGMKLLIDAGVDPYTISLLAANPVGGMHAQDLLSILEQEPA